MKFFLSLFIFVVGLINISAQNCTTMWPYLYKDFTEATIYFTDGKQAVQKANIHVLKSTLHFLDKENIKEALSEDVILVKIRDDVYYSKNGQMMKVVQNDNNGFIALTRIGDFEALQNKGTAAYGASSNSSAVKKLSSLEIGGISNVNHMNLRSNRDNGEEVMLIDKYYIITGNAVYLASKKGIESNLSDERKVEFKAFLKKNKIQWNNPGSLLKLLEFLNWN